MSIKLNSILFASLFFFACTDESPTSIVQENISKKEEQQKEEDCRYGTSRYSDSWCCTNYGYQCKQSSSSKKYSSSSYTGYYYSSSSAKSSSSRKYSSSSYHSSSSKKNSSSSAFNYLTESKNMKITLTYFKQVTPDWDNILNNKNYTDGDPRIFFELNFIDSNGKKTSTNTTDLLKETNVGEWSGRVSYTATVPMFTDTISVRPRVIDIDDLINDDYSSGYIYYRYNVGKNLKDNQVFYESDTENKNCIVKWEWYLY